MQLGGGHLQYLLHPFITGRSSQKFVNGAELVRNALPYRGGSGTWLVCIEGLIVHLEPVQCGRLHGAPLEFNQAILAELKPSLVVSTQSYRKDKRKWGSRCVRLPWHRNTP